MGKVGAFIYKRHKPPITVEQVFSFCSKHGLDINFVIEAGSHHGTDTVFFTDNQNIRKVFCFEPNPNSRLLFEQNMRDVSPDKFIQFNFGLSSSEKAGFLFFTNY